MCLPDGSLYVLKGVLREVQVLSKIHTDRIIGNINYGFVKYNLKSNINFDMKDSSNFVYIHKKNR